MPFAKKWIQGWLQKAKKIVHEKEGPLRFMRNRKERQEMKAQLKKIQDSKKLPASDMKEFDKII